MERKSILLTLILSCIPGLALVYAEKKEDAMLFAVTGCLGLMFGLTGVLTIIGLPIWFIATVASGVSAVQTVITYNRQITDTPTGNGVADAC